MNLSRAIARSYRYFVPRSFLHPRQLVRELYPQAFIYVAGVTTGMYCFCGRGQGEQITYWSIAAMSALSVIKWWAGHEECNRLPRA